MSLISGAYAGQIETMQRTAAVAMAANTKAGDLIREIADENMDYIKSYSAQARATLAPYVESGKRGAEHLETLLGFNGADKQQEYMTQIMNSPYVQSSIKLGQQAVQNTAASKGMLNSGRTIEQLFRLGQDVGSREIANVQNALLQLAGQGQQAASASAGVSYQTGKDVSQQNMQGGEAQAGAMIKNAQIYSESENAIAALQMQAALQGLDPTGQNSANAGGGGLGFGGMNWGGMAGEFLGGVGGSGAMGGLVGLAGMFL